MKTRLVHFRGDSILVTQKENGLWYGPDGCIFAYAEEDSSVDQEVRCGVGPFSLPKDCELNGACAPHDYAYSSPAYQEFHTREEADRMLEEHLKLVAEHSILRVLAWPFRWLSRVFGGRYWENKETND